MVVNRDSPHNRQLSTLHEKVSDKTKTGLEEALTKWTAGFTLQAHTDNRRQSYEWREVTTADSVQFLLFI